MIIAAVIVALLGICVYFVIRLDKKMKSQFGEDHLSDYAINSKVEELANEAVREDPPQEKPTEASLLAAHGSPKGYAIPQTVVPEEDSSPVVLAKRMSLFSADELRFWSALQEGLEGRWVLYPKQFLRDLVTAERDIPAAQAATLAVLRVDVLLCQAYTYTPVCALILVPDARQIDPETLRYRECLAEVCDAIELPLIKFVQAEEYSPLAIAARILKVLGTAQPVARLAASVVPEPSKLPISSPESPLEEPVPVQETVIPESIGPACPQCQGAMQQRKVKSGPHAGREVWACVKYPVCKGVVIGS